MEVFLTQSAPSKLASAADEADGAVAIVFNGPVSERTLEIASQAAIETVVGTKAEKDTVTGMTSNHGLQKCTDRTNLSSI